MVSFLMFSIVMSPFWRVYKSISDIPKNPWDLNPPKSWLDFFVAFSWGGIT